MKPRFTVRDALGLLAAGLFVGGVAAFLIHLRLANRGQPVQPIAARPADVVVLCIGDSLTADSYPARLEGKLKAWGVDARVLNYGVPGFTSMEYLDYMKSERLLEKTKPDVVLLQLGTNDVRADFNHTRTKDFDRNMREIVRLVTASGGKTRALLIALIPPVAQQFPSFSHKSTARVAGEINPTIRRIAEENRLLLVDNHTPFAEHPELMQGIHLSQDGYETMAENWFNALVKKRIVNKPVERK